MNEQIKFDVIKSLVDHGCKNKLRASLKLGCTIRTINRMIVGYKKQGKSFLFMVILAELRLIKHQNL